MPPGTGRILGTYASDFGPGPGFLLQLNHHSNLALTSLLWFHPGLGVLVLGMVTGAVLLRVYRWARARNSFSARLNGSGASSDGR